MWLQFWAGEREDKSTSQTAQNTNPASSLSKQVMQDSSHWICSSPGILGHDEHTNIAPVCPPCVSSGPRHNLLYLKLCSILTSPTLSRLPWLRCRPSTWICWTSRVHWVHCSACQVSDGIPCLGSTDCTTQLGVISNLLRVQAKHAANICWATFLKHCPDSTAEAETPSHIHQLNTSSLPPSIFPSPKDYLWALHPKDKDQLPWCTISGYMRVFFSLSRETST